MVWGDKSQHHTTATLCCERTAWLWVLHDPDRTRAKAGTSQNHRMAQVGRDLIDHLVPTPCHGQGCHPPDWAAQGPSRLALNTSRYGIRSQLLSTPCSSCSNSAEFISFCPPALHEMTILPESAFVRPSGLKNKILLLWFYNTGITARKKYIYLFSVCSLLI